MSPERWGRLAEIVGEAAMLDPEARGRFLDERCPDDAELRREAERLLANAEKARGFLESSPVRPRPHTPVQIGSTVGPYVLTSELGRGGMSIVYRAERAGGDLPRPAAVKVLSHGLLGAAWKDRLGAEARILANLQHPNIAALYDAGVSEGGAAYLVIELVEGEPLTAYCDARNLSLRKRLELFLPICAAVHFAHQRLVVHRDIKPANILVTAAGVPKLLDFGIAKLLTPEDAGKGQPATVLGAMTPGYASPEQILGQPVTTASDTYSLGVVLYEMLAGVRPFDFSGRSWTGIAELLEREQPPKPSSVRREIPGELDAITLKALRRDPAARYGSAEELAGDIRNFLAGRPVKARSAGALYLARKFVLRHRAGVAAAVLAALLTGMAALTAVQQRIKAERRFTQLRQLAGAVIFEFHDGISALPGTLEVRRKMVRRSLDYLDLLAAEAHGDIQFQIELAQGYLRLAEAQGKPTSANLGDFAGALESGRKARRLLEAALGAAPGNLEAARLLGRALLDIGQVQQRVQGENPEPTFEHALEYWQALAARHPGDAPTLGGLASAWYWRQELEKALEIYEQLLSREPANPDWSRNVAVLSRYLGQKHLRDAARSLGFIKRAIEIDRARVQARPLDRTARLDLSFDLSMLGSWHSERNEPGPAVHYFEQVLRVREELVRQDPRDEQARDRLLYALVELGRHEAMLHRWAQAKDHYARAVKLARQMARTGIRPNRQFEGLMAQARSGLEEANRRAAAR